MKDIGIKKYLSPGIALLLIAPIVGELLSGHQTLFDFINPLQFILSALPYGFGAIICRELKVRWGKGWFCLVLLGIVFGIYEEAIVARSFWDPNWSELGALRDYSYWKGVVWVYAELLVHFHLTISIISSVVLVEILYFDRRHQPWVSRWGFGACLVGLALWMPPLIVLNPFMPPLVGYILSWMTMIGLTYAAWRLPARIFRPRPGTTMRPLGYGIVAAVNTTLVFVSVFVLPEMGLPWMPPWPVLFVFLAVLDALTFWMIMRWSGNGTRWDDRHKLAMVIGLLSFFIFFDGLKDIFEQPFSGLSLVAVVASWSLWQLWIRTQARCLEGSCQALGS